MLDQSINSDSSNDDVNQEVPPCTPSPPRRPKRKSGNRTVIVEGNIGAGKSTFLNYFKRFKQVKIFPEPVSKWTNFGGHNAMDLMYRNPPRWSFAFESMVALTMLENHLEATGPSKVKMMERSIHTVKFCFAENFKQRGLMADVDHAILKEWYDWLNLNEDLDVDLYVYLRTSPEVCYQRLKKRNRSEEAGVPLDYLKSLHHLHDEWLLGGKNGQLNSNVLVLDGDKDLSELVLDIENVYHDVIGNFDLQ